VRPYALSLLDGTTAPWADIREAIRMYKLIGIILAAAPIVLFLRAIFKGQLQKRSQVLSDFRKQMDFLVWAILFFIGCGVVYAIGKLVYQFLT
jgi:hypothetical protein